MPAVTKLREPGTEPLYAVGEIMESDPAGLLVRSACGVFRARRALSCLVEPEPEDTVLLAGERERPYVIAVLERAESSPLRLMVDGDCELGVRNGRFSIAAENGMDLVSQKDIGISAAELDVHATRGSVFFGKLSYFGQKLFSQVSRVRLVAGVLDAVMESVSQTVKRSYRTVAEIDHLRSGEIDYRAEQNMSLHGRNALVSAEELVKMDGGQIHLG